MAHKAKSNRTKQGNTGALPAPRPEVFFVYAIACEGGSYYIGHTDDIPRRWQEHTSGKGADWIRKHKPRYLAHYEEFTSREEAVACEKELKSTNGRCWLKKAIAEGLARQAGGVPFEKKMAALSAELYEQSVLPARVNQHVSIIWPKPDELIPRFLRYFLVLSTMQAQMLSWAHAGATRKALTKGMIESFKVPKPDLTIQQRIAYILGALDDEIELNRRMKRTLEKMAVAIFKSWFIDFDPVSAKAEGRDPGLPQKIADLFPDSFEDSELGKIPRMWSIKKLGEVCEKPQYGFTASAKEAVVGPKFLRITDINKLSWIEWATVPYCEITPADQEKYKLRIGDFFFPKLISGEVRAKTIKGGVYA